MPELGETLVTARSSETIHGDVLEGRDIICFSNDWGGDPYSKTHLMRRLARNNRVLWINSIGSRRPRLCRRDLARLWRKLWAAAQPLAQPEANLYVLNPLAVPMHHLFGVASLNGWLLRRQILAAMRQLGFVNPISWVFLPWAASVVGSLGEARVVYHCVDEFTAFEGVPPEATSRMENDLMSRADLVIVASTALLESKRPHHDRVVLVRHGVDHELFRKALAQETQVPEQMRSLPKPVLGFFGLISSDWIDLDLVEHLARSFPAASVVLLGTVIVDVRRLESLPNVHFLGRVPYTDLPGYCKGFDVALIPFVRSALTQCCNPLKAWQYLAAGLPLVSTPIPAVAELPGCRVAHDMNSFVDEVARALGDAGPTLARSALVQRDTWEARIAEIQEHFRELESNHGGPE